MKIDRLTERKIKDAAHIVDVAGDFLDLHKRGPVYLALCPFHEDHHLGSFKIYPNTNTFRCYACGAHGDSIEFLRKHLGLKYDEALQWLAQRYSIDLGTMQGMMKFARPKKQPAPKPLPTLIIPRQYVKKYMNTKDDTFCNWLRALPWNKTQRARLEHTLWLYAVGHAPKDYTIFWQVTDTGEVRDGHMMKYKSDGHRDKEGEYTNTWMHAYLPWAQNFNTRGTEPRYTLFGMHLLNKYPSATINIVESEKTALLCAIYFGNSQRSIWMACGGLTMLTPERLDPIFRNHRYMILYPDKDGVERWQQQREKLGYVKCHVYTDYLTERWKPEDGPKADYGDIIVRLVREQSLTPLEVMEKRNPNIKELVNKLNLEIVKA